MLATFIIRWCLLICACVNVIVIASRDGKKCNAHLDHLRNDLSSPEDHRFVQMLPNLQASPEATELKQSLEVEGVQSFTAATNLQTSSVFEEAQSKPGRPEMKNVEDVMAAAILQTSSADYRVQAKPGFPETKNIKEEGSFMSAINLQTSSADYGAWPKPDLPEMNNVQDADSFMAANDLQTSSADYGAQAKPDVPEKKNVEDQAATILQTSPEVYRAPAKPNSTKILWCCSGLKKEGGRAWRLTMEFDKPVEQIQLGWSSHQIIIDMITKSRIDSASQKTRRNK
eukprot:gnl/MRDRNA2_/MRDRNA2_82219_c0_seq3.p1 gnl/MRDRNA2_/MRDRNA2_82219_c0~~gnl/MRDRNA2_/MRDRNA2_82219_c0_seq3.p1  ORF type:complete len:318 (+),score=64.08 gnl/MRDRNA2_/MRDRNA2_82219_c0_seq3:100-954(+)